MNKCENSQFPIKVKRICRALYFHKNFNSKQTIFFFFFDFTTIVRFRFFQFNKIRDKFNVIQSNEIMEIARIHSLIPTDIKIEKKNVCFLYAKRHPRVYDMKTMSFYKCNSFPFQYTSIFYFLFFLNNVFKLISFYF